MEWTDPRLIRSDAFKLAGERFKDELREMLEWSVRYDAALPPPPKGE